jgi:hypothetical protein
MKFRIMIVVAAVAALAVFGGISTAKAASPLSNYLDSITCASPGPVLSGEGVEGLTEEESACEGVNADTVGLAVPVCIDGTTYQYLEDQDGDFDYTAADLVSDLSQDFGVSASVGACGGGGTTPKQDGIFLCYSTFQTDPGVWPKSEAEVLLKQGYWLPYAVPDNVTGGTNLGGFHLACNLAASQSVGDSFVGLDGTVFGPAYTGVEGLYPKVG